MKGPVWQMRDGVRVGGVTVVKTEPREFRPYPAGDNRAKTTQRRKSGRRSSNRL